MRVSLPQWSAGLWCLQLSAFLTNFGFFMLIPLLALHFTHNLGISLTMAGVLYSVRLFSQQGMMLFGGMFADRVGYRETIVIGSMIRACGFAMFGLTNSLPLLFVAGILAGLGGALFGPAWQAATTELSTPENREQIFAWRNILGNTGLTLGPMVGAWMSGMDIFIWICCVSAGIFLFFGFLVWIFVPKIQVIKRDHPSMLRDIRHIAENRTFVWLTVWLMGFNLIYQQIYMMLPYFAHQEAGRDLTGYLFTALSLMVILFQHPISRLIDRIHAKPFPVMALGMLLLGLSFAPAILSINLFTVVLPLVGIGFSNILIQPTSQTWIANISERQLVASYFGFSSLSNAIGGTIGNSGGGWITEQAYATGHHQLPFILFTLIGVGCALAIWMIDHPRRASEAQTQISRTRSQ